MEKFTPLAKFLHCHRQWRHGQISPLKNGSGMLLEKVGESETISHCTGSQGKLLRVLYNAPKVGWFWTPTTRYLPWETSSKRKVNQTYNVCKYFSERNKNRILWFCWGEKSKASIFDLVGMGVHSNFWPARCRWAGVRQLVLVLWCIIKHFLNLGCQFRI